MTCSATFSLGDHLVSSRFGYQHHGIYVGGDRVVHYAGLSDVLFNKNGVMNSSLGEFTQGHKVWVKDHPHRLYTPEETVERAFGKVGEEDYSLFFNNCEHFANWCIEGKNISHQVRKAVSSAFINAGALKYVSTIATPTISAPAGTIVCEPAPTSATTILAEGLRIGSSAVTQPTVAATVFNAAKIASFAPSVGGISSTLGGAGVGAGVGVGAASTTTGTAVVSSLVVGLGGTSAIATLAVPMVVGGAVGAVGYGLYKIWQKIFD